MRVVETVQLGLKNLFLHKLRSMLTILGIIFGVAAVISMLSIGEGARHEALQQIKLLGVQNITIRSIRPPEAEKKTEATEGSIAYGLTMQDPEHIKSVCSAVEAIVPVKQVRKDAWFGDRKTEARIVGTTPEYKDIINFHPGRGRFITPLDNREAKTVCVIGTDIKRRLFAYRSPLQEQIKIGNLWFDVVGVMEDKSISGKASSIKIHDLNKDIYIPFNTADLRFGDFYITRSAGEAEYAMVDIDELIVKIKDEKYMGETAIVINRVLEKRHKNKDYEIIIPQELIRQRQKTSRIFNIVMVSIASISLLVGGIGIMNIMLASITERTSEIGVRRAMGAKKRDIIRQFLIETVVLSLTGGIIGMILGVGGAKIVTYFAQWKTIVTLYSLVIAFGISVIVGIIFGMYPANKAANMNPIDALRYE